MAFKELIEKWQSEPVVIQSERDYMFKLDIDDAAKIDALTALFPAIDAETVIADLLHKALESLEAAIPYEAGDRVIQEDEFGDPVYEDAGLMPDYVKLVREYKDKSC